MYNGKERRSLGVLAASALGCALSAVVSALLLILAALVLMSAPDPASLSWIGTAVLCIGSAAGAFAACRCSEKHRFASGIISGAVFSLVIAVVSASISGNVSPAPVLASAGSALAGAFIGSIRTDRSSRLPDMESGRFDKFSRLTGSSERFE